LLHEEEAAQLGVTHAQVGAYLLGLWGMPAHLVEAAALHHSPDQVYTREFSVLTAVHVADVLAHHQAGEKTGATLPWLHEAYLAGLNLPTSIEQWQAELGTAPVETLPAATEQSPSTPEVVKPANVERIPLPAERASRPWPFTLPAAAAAVVLLTGGLLWRYSRPLITTDISATPMSQPAAAASTELSSAPTAEPGPVSPPAETAAAMSSAEPASDPASPAPDTRPSSTNDLTASPDGAAPEPAPVATSEVAVVVAPSKPQGFSSVRVQGIFYRPTKPSVVINGKTLGIGERVNDVRVVAIGQNRVTLEYAGEQKIIQLR
jgi:hypothetical protein